MEMYTNMIRFVLGMFSLILTVAGIEGSASLSFIIMAFTTGIALLCWGIVGMNRKGQLAL